MIQKVNSLNKNNEILSTLRDILKRPPLSISSKLNELSYFKYFKICRLSCTAIVQKLLPFFKDNNKLQKLVKSNRYLKIAF